MEPLWAATVRWLCKTVICVAMLAFFLAILLAIR